MGVIIMRIRRIRGCLALLTAFFVCICAGCAAPAPASAERILDAMREAAPGLPAGRCYLRAVDSSSRAYLSGDLLSALLGSAARGLFEASPAGESKAEDGGETAGVSGAVPDVPAVYNACVYLSETASPGELAVLICSDTDSALTAAALYRRRLDMLSAVFPDTESAVRVRGCVVLAAFCRDAGEVVKAAG